MSKLVRERTFVSGIAIGGAVGALCGLLIAPRTGKETRKLLKKSAAALPELTEDLASTIQMRAEHLGAKTTNNWQATLSKLRIAIAAGVAASQQEREREQALSLSRNSTPAAKSSRP